VKLDQLLDTAELSRLVAENYITARDHPTLPYKILNYTPKAQFDRHWTRETELSRGLMYDTRDGTVIGRPFPKFFNWGEREVVIPDEPFAAYEKLDGSLGISYVDADGLPSIATRGSFGSYQAKRGTQVLRSTYAHTLDKILALREITLCFEIILPEYRIVVDYAGREDLVLLAAFEIETGHEIDLDDPRLVDLGFPMARRYPAANLEEARALVETPLFDNAEGVVVRFEGGLRLKLKREEYQRLHRIITGVTPRRIWEMLKDGTPPVDRLFSGTPAPFQTWARAEIASIEERRAEIEGASQEAYREITDAVPADDRKAFAMQAARHRYRAILFKMFDRQPYDEIIWKLVRPGPADAFRVEV
jgi:RNA ligase